MKICWDNLEGVYLNKRGEFKKGRHLYRETNCEECGELCLVTDWGQFCSRSCARLGERSGNWKGGLCLDKKAYMKEWRLNNFKHIKEYYLKNKEKILKLSAEYKKKYSEKHCATQANRRAKKLNQTPKDVNQKIIGWYYTLCKQMSKRIGILGFYHVDHIIPLSKGGLHHENNLQILTAKQNFSKHAKLLK